MKSRKVDTLVLDEEGKLVRGNKPLNSEWKFPTWVGDEDMDLMKVIEEGRHSSMEPRCKFD